MYLIRTLYDETTQYPSKFCLCINCLSRAVTVYISLLFKILKKFYKSNGVLILMELMVNKSSKSTSHKVQ